MSEKEITERRNNLMGHGSTGSKYSRVDIKLYFYNGKLFGLRASEHMLIHLSNIVVEGNKIAFDEFRGKMYKGGLKDLKNKPRYIEHICHKNRQNHSPCLASMYSVYIKKIRSHAESINSFYFRPHRGRKIEYEKSPVGVCTLNKIVPEKFVGKGRIASQDDTGSMHFSVIKRLMPNRSKMYVNIWHRSMTHTSQVKVKRLRHVGNDYSSA